MHLGTGSSSGLGTLAGLCLETGLDSTDGTLRTTFFAGDKENTVLLCEFGLWTLASLANDVLGDVSSKNVFDLLGLETTTDDETLGAVDGTNGTQLSEEELDDVLWLTVHTLANVDDVGKYGLFGTISGDLRRDHGELLLVAGEGGVLCTKRLEDAAEELLVCVIAVCALPCFNRVIFWRCVDVVYFVLSKRILAEFLVIHVGVCIVGGLCSIVCLIIGLADFLFEGV